MAIKERKIAIVGARNVGKSSLTTQFTEHHFVDHYYPTIENHANREVNYKGVNYGLEVMDTARPR